MPRALHNTGLRYSSSDTKVLVQLKEAHHTNWCCFVRLETHLVLNLAFQRPVLLPASAAEYPWDGTVCLICSCQDHTAGHLHFIYFYVLDPPPSGVYCGASASSSCVVVVGLIKRQESPKHS